MPLVRRTRETFLSAEFGFLVSWCRPGGRRPASAARPRSCPGCCAMSSGSTSRAGAVVFLTAFCAPLSDKLVDRRQADTPCDHETTPDLQPLATGREGAGARSGPTAPDKVERSRGARPKTAQRTLYPRDPRDCVVPGTRHASERHRVAPAEPRVPAPGHPGEGQPATGSGTRWRLTSRGRSHWPRCLAPLFRGRDYKCRGTLTAGARLTGNRGTRGHARASTTPRDTPGRDYSSVRWSRQVKMQPRQPAGRQSLGSSRRSPPTQRRSPVATALASMCRSAGGSATTPPCRLRQTCTVSALTRSRRSAPARRTARKRTALPGSLPRPPTFGGRAARRSAPARSTVRSDRRLAGCSPTSQGRRSSSPADAASRCAPTSSQTT